MLLTSVPDSRMESMTTAPTFWQVAKRPQWIWILVACLVVAGIFGALANWQTARAVEGGQGDNRDTETPVALDSVAVPGEPLTSEAGGRIVTTTAVVQPDDFLVLNGRKQQGEEGCWVIGRAIVEQGEHKGTSLAFASHFVEGCGEAEIDEALNEAGAYAGSPTELVGRYMPSESPTIGEFETGESRAMSVAELINTWSDYEPPVYAGYLLLHDPADPQTSLSIHSERPVTRTDLNWLNVFYAAEWLLFGGFALYLWYRLVKDARDQDLEALEDDDLDLDDISTDELDLVDLDSDEQQRR